MTVVSGPPKGCDGNEECSICFNNLGIPDQLFTLNCTTPSCRFNYCYDCIAAFQQSVSKTREENSSSSNHMRRRHAEIEMLCPHCRGTYRSPTHTSEKVVEAVMMLREAYTMQSLLATKDSDLSATDLGRKDRFIHRLDVQGLKESIRTLEGYNNEIGKNKKLLPSLDWDLFMVGPEKRLEFLYQGSRWRYDWKDPSLFLGLDSLMTPDEQAYVTELFVSGQADFVAQAALILHGLMRLQTNRELAAALMARAVEHLAVISGLDDDEHCGPQQLQYKLRRRYPLPPHMPRCVSLPISDPDGDILHLFNLSEDLSLRTVFGPAGYSGLRRGDVITHVNGESVKTKLDVQKAAKQATLYNPEFPTVLVVVNANEATAMSLQERSLHMKFDGLDP